MIDVSIANGAIDWAKVAAAGVKYAMIRCGEGLNDMDPNLEKNVQGCKDNSIMFGLYRVLVPKSGNPAGQAAKLIGLSQKYEAQLYPVVDVEKNRALTPDEQKIWSKFLKDYMESSSETIVLYTYSAFLPQIQFDGIKNYKIWIANYGAKTTPSLPGYDVYAWQKSCTGKIDGIKTDVDINELYQPPAPPVSEPVVVEEPTPANQPADEPEPTSPEPAPENTAQPEINKPKPENPTVSAINKVMPYVSVVPWIKKFFFKKD